MADFTLVYAQASLVARNAAQPPDYNMPIGCLSLMATLEQHGLRVDFRDYQFNDGDEPQSPDSLASFLEDAADVVGVGCLVDFLPIVVLALRRFKEQHPEKTVVLGGPGPSDCAVGLMKTFPWIDVVVIGEGEVTLVELLDHLAAGRDLGSVAGIVYRDGGEVRRTPPRARIQDLDTLPFPHHAGVDLSRYSQVNVMTSRGCPYDCTFCDVSQLWERKTTYRSLDSVIAELRELHRRGVREVSIQDDNFTLNRKRVRRFTDKVRGLRDIPAWACLGRVDLVNEELLTAMQHAGCQGIFYGVESGSNAVLGGIMKNITAEVSSRAVEMTVERFGVKTYFIWGFPHESLADLTETLLLMSYFKSLGAKTPITLLAPLTQSALYRSYGQQLRLDPRLFEYNFVSGMLYERNDTRVFDLVRQHPELFPSFYTYPTPDVERKLDLIGRFKPFNDLDFPASPEARERPSEKSAAA